MQTNEAYPVEIEIPVPWGHVSGKDWGPPTGKPLLGLHGWQDNSGTLDLLAPHVPGEWRLIAIDFPGHGHSSHLPSGMPYEHLGDVATVRRVVKHFGWSSFSIMGHSMGAGIGLLYASLFPEEIEKLVLLDAVRITTGESRKGRNMPMSTGDRIDAQIETEAKMNMNGAPIYTHEEAFDRLLKANEGELIPRSVEILLKRGSKPADDDPSKVVFTRDPRVRIPTLHRMSHDQMLQYGTRMRCELLVIRAIQPRPKGKMSKGDEDIEAYLKQREKKEKEMVQMFVEGCRGFHYVLVPGTHFVHLNQPEVVCHYVASFLNEYHPKNRL